MDYVLLIQTPNFTKLGISWNILLKLRESLGKRKKRTIFKPWFLFFPVMKFKRIEHGVLMLVVEN